MAEELFDLERLLRTGKYEQQIGSLHRFPTFMKNHQDTLSICAAFMRLADAFVSSTSELRSEIVVTFKSCSEYSSFLGEQIDEVIRRLGVIWGSNDILARALVIRIFGSLALVTADRPEAIYRIQQSLLSEHEIEYESAVNSSIMLVNVNPKRILASIADSAIYLLTRINPYSRLLHRILSLLELGWGDWKSEVYIYHNLKAIALSNDTRKPDIQKSLYLIAKRNDQLLQDYYLNFCDQMNVIDNVNL